MGRDIAGAASGAETEASDASGRPLRRGWTTGACAAAAARAAAEALLGPGCPDPVEVDLPRGLRPAFPIVEFTMGDGWARASVRKDAGDDPDVTHGALIVTEVRRAAPDSGITFRAGAGVGTVTRPGLPIPVGDPAISPAPRGYISAALADVAAREGVAPDLEVIISIPGGERIAERTMNGRLGIVGGLSILGTTGVVIPYSCGAWIASIHRGVDVARAAGLAHVAATTGRTSEAGVRALYGLPDTALIEMGDFAGGLLKYVARHPIPRLTIGGGFAKIAKLAAGHLDLHSKRSALDVEALAAQLADLGADDALIRRAAASGSGNALLEIAEAAGLAVADMVAGDACRVARAALAREAGNFAGQLDVVVFDRTGRLIGRATG